MKQKTKKILFFVVFVIIITPLGILTNSPAWGEWENSFFTKVLGFIPEGIQKTSDLIVPLFPDYSVSGNSKIVNQYLSALIGAVIIFMIFYLVRLTLITKKSDDKGNN
ncbi:cobalt transport protein CbiM [bacterium BMS3Abin04]|nr:cobalt transport protein CbiM [bacterium BMS3Abin04]